MERIDAVKIAPDMGEIKFSENRTSIFCTFNGIRVEFKLPKGMTFSNNDDYHKKAFQAAIAFSSKPWQLQSAMNSMYHIQGECVTKEIVEG